MVENRADILIQSILRSKQLCFNGTNALLFGRGMQQAVQCLEDAKMRVTILNAPFQRFCFIPLDENGILLLKLIYDAEAHQSLLAVLAEDLQQKEEQPFIIQTYPNIFILRLFICEEVFSDGFQINRRKDRKSVV